MARKNITDKQQTNEQPMFSRALCQRYIEQNAHAIKALKDSTDMLDDDCCRHRGITVTMDGFSVEVCQMLGNTFNADDGAFEIVLPDNVSKDRFLAMLDGDGMLFLASIQMGIRVVVELIRTGGLEALGVVLGFTNGIHADAARLERIFKRMPCH